MTRTVVIIPTFNERDALPVTLGRLRTAVPDADVLVVDDGSPDGTGELADRIAADDPAVHVLHRTEKLGLGRAYVAGFAWALDRGYDVVVEMDADGSHRPEDLPRLLAAMPDADLVLGARWVPGGVVVNWPRRREVLSRAANTYTRLMLGLSLHDSTAGFRAFRAPMLASLPLDAVASRGYCFQVDMAWRVQRSGGRVVEVPITFVEREQGTSKMSRDIVVEALTRITIWGLAHRAHQVSAGLHRVAGRFRRPAGRPAA